MIHASKVEDVAVTAIPRARYQQTPHTFKGTLIPTTPGISRIGNLDELELWKILKTREPIANPVFQDATATGLELRERGILYYL